MRLCRFTLSILVAGLIVLVAIGWGAFAHYSSGRSFGEFHSFSLLIPSACIFVVGIFLAGSLPVVVYRFFRHKEFQPAIASSVVAIGIVATTYLPLPTFFDGFAESLSEIDPEFFDELSDALRQLPPPEPDDLGDTYGPEIPLDTINRFPTLDRIFPPPQFGLNYNISPNSVTVHTGGSRSGHRGFRIFSEPDIDPYEGETEYIGSFRKVHPGVFTYVRFF